MAPTKPTPRAHPAASGPPSSPRTEDHQGYRRGRVIRSCLECRRRKMRCDRARPCQNCNRFCRKCIYLPFPEWPPGASKDLREEGSSRYPEQGHTQSFPSLSANQSTGFVQPSPFTHHHFGFVPDTRVKYEELYDIDMDDEASDVSLQIGRLSITEKSGGCLWSHVTTKIAALLSQTGHTVGPYHPRTAYGVPATQHPIFPAALPTLVFLKEVLSLEPAPGHLATNSRPFLPQPALELPSCTEVQLLYRRYWPAVDALAHIIHKPYFESECRRYLLHSQIIDDAPVSFKALFLAMCLASAISLSPQEVEEVLGVTQQMLVGRLKMATEKALGEADFINSVNIQTLQAFTTYLTSQCRAEISRSHKFYVGALVSLALSAGMHRDPSGSDIDPVECQVRRLLWHQVCFLDLLTAEARGTRPTIHNDHFDTILPRNIDDHTLDWPENESALVPRWTDATFSIIRYECSIVVRLILGQRLAIEHGQTDLKTARNLVGARGIRIERKYLQYLDDNIPVQRCAKLVGRLFIAKFDVMLLSENWQMGVNTDFQSDIRETVVESCLKDCECASALETDPDLAPWIWYARAHHQYHGSIHLLMEVHRDPCTVNADRINRVLDHVFGVAPNLTSRERSGNLLQLLVEEIDKMIHLRKLQIPHPKLSDDGSMSPNDHLGMVKAQGENQQSSQWQPNMMNNHGYRQDLNPVSDIEWWPTDNRHRLPDDPTVPWHDKYPCLQHDICGHSSPV